MLFYKNILYMKILLSMQNHRLEFNLFISGYLVNSNILYKLKFSKVNINLPLVSRGELFLESAHTKIQACSSHLCKIEKYSISTESTDAKPAYIEGRLYWGISTFKYTIGESLNVLLIKIETFEI